ncbi:MAG: ComEC/Rec2 family competence protein [Hydrogenothermaceae bacterium]
MYITFKPVVDINRDVVFVECLSLDVPNRFDNKVSFSCKVINSDIKDLVGKTITVSTEDKDIFIFSRVAFLGKIKSEDGSVKAYPKKGFVKVDNSLNPFIYIKDIKEDLIKNYSYRALNNQSYNLGLGLIFGESSGISGKDYQKFVESGLAHMLAISGSHIAILIFSLNMIFSFLNTYIRNMLIFLILPLYAVFTGFTVPVIRACFMGMLYSISKIKYLRFNSLNVLFFVGFVYLVFYPDSLFSASFQLSFLAALSIIFGIDLFKDKNILVSTLGVSFLATLFTAPVVMYHFGNVSLNSILSTPIATLPMYPYLTLAFLNIFTGFNIDFLVKVMDAFGVMFLDIVHMFEKFPFYFAGFKPSLFFVVLFYLFFIMAIFLNIRLSYKILVVSVVFVIFAIISKSDKNQFVIYSFKSREYPVVFIAVKDRCYIITDYPVYKQLSLFSKEDCKYKVLLTEKPERFKYDYTSNFDEFLIYTYQIETPDFIIKKWTEYRLYRNSQEYIIKNQDGIIKIE